MTHRYSGKPFLELVDSFVLDAIGHLDDATARSLREREPLFRDLFGERGGWRDMVVARMQFPKGMAGAIREVWDKGRVRFVSEQGREPDPREFAQHFVDTKFPH